MSIERFLAFNLLMDLSILVAVARCCGVFRLWRTLGTGMLCALYGLLAALVPHPWRDPLPQLGMLTGTACLLNRPLDVRRTLALTLTLGGAAMLLGGAEALLVPRGAKSFPQALVLHIAGTALLHLFLNVRRRLRSEWHVSLRIDCADQRARFPALIDTGNRLSEPLSGQPVLIAEASLLKGVLPQTGWRQIAYGALGGSGTLDCFRPDAVWVETQRGPRRAPDLWIAVLPTRLPGSSRALAPAELFPFVS